MGNAKEGECYKEKVRAGDPTRLGCPQGTARIQVRCRAVSATVPSPLLVSYVVPAPKMAPESPQKDPKTVRMRQKSVQEGQDGFQNGS